MNHYATISFELNGQPRSVDIKDKSIALDDLSKEIYDPSNITHIGAPIPGLLVDVSITEGISIAKGAKLCTIEAMKMETEIRTSKAGVVGSVTAKEGDSSY